jgi:DNA-binding FrmR family transcriptional regulator
MNKGGMHMMADKAQVSRLLKTARGQIDGILKMIEEDRYCMDISHQVMATEAILRRANKEIIRAHMKGCIADALASENGDEKIDELMDILDKFSH